MRCMSYMCCMCLVLQTFRESTKKKRSSHKGGVVSQVVYRGTRGSTFTCFDSSLKLRLCVATRNRRTINIAYVHVDIKQAGPEGNETSRLLVKRSSHLPPLRSRKTRSTSSPARAFRTPHPKSGIPSAPEHGGGEGGERGHGQMVHVILPA